jgi:Ca2+ transporting ATPase
MNTSIALNIDCIINKLEKPDINEDLEICESKNKTDKGFIEFLYQYKSPISVKRDLYLSSPENYKIFPFDSTKKRMTTFVKNKIFPTGYRLFTKGGAENATLYCSNYIDKKTGDIKNFNEDIKNFINKEIEEMNKEMMRTLYLCYRDITKEEYDNCNNADEKGILIDQKNLTFIGVFGLRDSLRAGVKEAVKKCHEAGVKVIMVTGDNLITAASIAKECNILSTQFNLDQLCSKSNEQKKNADISSNEKDKNIKDILNSQTTVMTGNDFYNAIEGIYCQICNKDTNLCQCPKSEAEAEELAKNSNDKTKKPVKKDAIKNMNNFMSISKNLLILARSQPIHKYALVLGLKDLENVVAVTGDGTNDAPALSKSDVGFAMAEGTDIAKEASDIIILDNNFSSIVIAIIYGRSIYENIRKFLQFQLTVNFAACILVFLCSCIGNETPLNSIQMLWVNLIMDSLGSLALATEPPYNELLNKKPTDRNESIINGRMWKHIIFQSILEIVILLILYFTAPKFFPEFKQEINDFAKLVNKCFGQLPGEEKLSNRILYGNKDKWSKDIYLKDNLPESVKLECEVFLRNNRTKWEDVSLFDAYNYNQNIYGGTTHMTLIFDVFVCFTLFNQINCRINDDSFNTFTRINKGLMFCIVTSLELIIQIILSQFGYKVFHCVYHGLTFVQWVICLLLSLNTMSFNLILKLIPFENVIDSWTKSNKNLLNKNSKDISEIGHLLKEGLINDDM